MYPEIAKATEDILQDFGKIDILANYVDGLIKKINLVHITGCSSKGTLISFTKSLAMELGELVSMFAVVYPVLS